jgi:cytochrome b6-f complex iron-sulfur subunit
MDSLTRRQFLEGSAAILGVSLAGCGAQPASGPSARAGEGGAIILTGVPTLEPGAGQIFIFPGGEPGLIFKAKDGTSGAVSAKCTHAGCTVEWDGRAKIPLRCPCHESHFALDGQVLSGPAKAPLKHYAVSVTGEEITLRPL